MKVEIRQTGLDDLNQIMEIEPLAFGSRHWSRDSFINELNNPGGHYFSAIDSENRIICAYSGFWLIGEEAHITTLAVHPSYRRKGLGELLLLTDIHSAIKVGAALMTLEVRVSNESAQKLYYKYGFKSLGLRRKYYQDNDEDALVLWSEKITSNEFLTILDKRILEWSEKQNIIVLSSELSGLNLRSKSNTINLN